MHPRWPLRFICLRCKVNITLCHVHYTFCRPKASLSWSSQLTRDGPPPSPRPGGRPRHPRRGRPGRGPRGLVPCRRDPRTGDFEPARRRPRQPLGRPGRGPGRPRRRGHDPQPPERRTGSLGRGPGGGRPHLRARTRDRDRQQRREPDLRGRRASRAARCRAAAGRRTVWTARSQRAAGEAARLRGPSGATGHAALRGVALQRGRGGAGGGGHGDGQVARVPGPGGALGAPQRRARGGVHQHHQPSGAAGGEGPGHRARGDRRGLQVGAHEGPGELHLDPPRAPGGRFGP